MSTLTVTQCEVLCFEDGWAKYPGVKEGLIRERFRWSATRYFQVLDSLLDRPEAEAYDPTLVRRLRGLRDRRRARRMGVTS